jgi:hypothetical protein
MIGLGSETWPDAKPLGSPTRPGRRFSQCAGRWARVAGHWLAGAFKAPVWFGRGASQFLHTVPQRRAFSVVPSGLGRPSSAPPKVETLGYFQESLRGTYPKSEMLPLGNRGIYARCSFRFAVFPFRAAREPVSFRTWPLSFFFWPSSSRAAWAAARRATGTRKGEQLT